MAKGIIKILGNWGNGIKVKPTIGIKAERDGDWRQKYCDKEKISAYFPLENCDSDSRIEALLAKLVKILENQENFLK